MKVYTASSSSYLLLLLGLSSATMIRVSTAFAFPTTAPTSTTATTTTTTTTASILSVPTSLRPVPSCPQRIAFTQLGTSMPMDELTTSSSSSLSSSKRNNCKQEIKNIPKSSTTKRASTPPDWDYQGLAQQVFEDDDRPIVLFDGVCHLCDTTVNFLMDNDPKAKLRFCSYHSCTAESLKWTTKPTKDSPQQQDELKFAVATSPTQIYEGSEAFVRICEHLGGSCWWLAMVGTLGRSTPYKIRESVYDFVSHHRHVFGTQDQCRLDLDGVYQSRFVSDPPELSQV